MTSATAHLADLIQNICGKLSVCLASACPADHWGRCRPPALSSQLLVHCVKAENRKMDNESLNRFMAQTPDAGATVTLREITPG